MQKNLSYTHHTNSKDLIRVKVSILVVKLLNFVNEKCEEGPPNNQQCSSEKIKNETVES